MEVKRENAVERRHRERLERADKFLELYEKWVDHQTKSRTDN